MDLRRSWFLTLCLLSASGMCAIAQSRSETPEANPPGIAAANPGRPTVATPATLTPVGYLQFETGFLTAQHSPELVSQTSFNEVIKYSVSRWIELLMAAQPYAHTNPAEPPGNAPGGVALGIQAVVHHGEGANPSIALSYFGTVYAGNAPDLDIGSFKNAALLMASADVRGFHYDANFFLDEVVNGAVRRAQLGQALSVSHSIGGKFGLSGEIWHFTQPFLRGNAVGNLWALDFSARKNLVFDCGFNHGLTSTSTQWAVFAGFTYLLPHKSPLTWPDKRGGSQKRTGSLAKHGD